MFLKDTHIAKSITTKLSEFNIQTVEQLLAADKGNKRRLNNLALVLKMSTAEVLQIIYDLEKEYPEFHVTPARRATYHTGYRLDKHVVENILSQQDLEKASVI